MGYNVAVTFKGVFNKGEYMKIRKQLAIAMAAAAAITCILAPAAVSADDSSTSAAVQNKTYVSLGADLSADEKAKVLELLGISEDQLSSDITVSVTNAEEHQYLDSYLDSSVIGTRALSSCSVKEEASGSGIQVETHNITYVTPAMYENALATAGMKNASVVVAGPFDISGTAALVGAMKAYEKMTGDVIQPELVDASNDELVTTSQVAADVGDSDKVAQMIAAIKQIIVQNNYTSDEDIGKAVDDVAAQMQITLSDKDRELIIELMKKISSLNLDVNTLTEQAQNIYNEIKNGNLDLSKYGITEEQTQGILEIFQKFFSQITSWFSSLFGG